MIEFIWNNCVNFQEKKEYLINIIKNKNFSNIILNSHQNTNKKELVLLFLKKFYNEINIKDYVLIINANEDGGIKIIRDKVKNFASSMINSNNFSKNYYFKTIVIENAHILTQDAQNALRRIMEDFSRITRFILIIEDDRTIIDALFSRCSYLYFPIYEKELLIKICHQFFPDINHKDKFIEISNYNIYKMKNYYRIFKSINDEINFFNVIENNIFKYNSNNSSIDFFIKRDAGCPISLNI